MERDFKGIWIPKDIWLCKGLTAVEKVLLMEIDSLDSTEKHCYASNKALAEFCNVSESKVSRGVAKLVEMGFIAIKEFDGRHRVLVSNLGKKPRLTRQKAEAEKAKSLAIKKEKKTTNAKKIETKKSSGKRAVIGEDLPRRVYTEEQLNGLINAFD